MRARDTKLDTYFDDIKRRINPRDDSEMQLFDEVTQLVELSETITYKRILSQTFDAWTSKLRWRLDAPKIRKKRYNFKDTVLKSVYVNSIFNTGRLTLSKR